MSVHTLYTVKNNDSKKNITQVKTLYTRDRDGSDNGNKIVDDSVDITQVASQQSADEYRPQATQVSSKLDAQHVTLIIARSYWLTLYSYAICTVVLLGRFVLGYFYV